MFTAGGNAVNKPDAVASDAERPGGPVFVSYATSDRKTALAVCKAIERRGTRCWISCRDVAPGENYQEAIVRAIRNAPAVVLVFSEAANNSDEIKKELSLVSRFRIPLMALRIEDVEPSDAFAYELSTRQWIDAFGAWDKSLDALARRLEQVSSDGVAAAPAADARRVHRRRAVPGGPIPRRTLAVAAAFAMLLMAAAAAWLLLRPSGAAAHTMQVRLTGFSRLSPELPSTMPDALRDEIIAALGEDGVVGASTAAAPPPGNAPAYTLGGTIRREGDNIRVIARLANERSGATLWSHSFTYAWDQLSRAPRRVAVHAGNLVRCGLFAASTYPKPLPDPVLADYLQYCHNTGSTGVEFEPTKSLDFARRVVAAAPNFSWGWSAVVKAAINATYRNQPQAQIEALKSEARRAADKAIQLDPGNSEALSWKSYLLDSGDLLGRERVLRQSLDARPLACGCEHHFYGNLLMEVGRTADAIGEYRRSTDVLALNGATQLSLAEALLSIGRPEQAKQHLDAAADLTDDPTFHAVTTAPITGAYLAAAEIVGRPDFSVAAALRPALIAAFESLASGEPAAKARAAASLAALPSEFNGRLVVTLLGALGANREALAGTEAADRAGKPGARSWLFYPSMAGARADPSFPAVAQRLGLVKYWRESETKPDFCSDRNAPAVCQMI